MSDIVGKAFPCSFVGSYPRPTWFAYNLGNRDLLEAFRDEDFSQAYRDAIRVIVGDQIDAGLDVLTDGHLWYDKHQGFIASFLLYNLERIGGIETRPTAAVGRTQYGDKHGFDDDQALGRLGRAAEVLEIHMLAKHVVIDEVQRGPTRHALNWSLAQQCAGRPVKAFFAMGPVELSALVDDEYYHDNRALLRDLAQIFRAEVEDAVAAGAQIIELDDLIFFAAREDWAYGVEILNSIVDGIDAYKIWHCCHGGTPAPVGMAPYGDLFPYVRDLEVDSFDWAFAQTDYRTADLQLFADPSFDKDLGLGVISNKNYVIESAREIANGIKKAAQYVDPMRIHVTSDCGLFAYPRAAARAKLRAMVDGAALARSELGL
jgi:5-methyltetrahydropteroyltriglutamate--homocysteine methyltransferase